MQEKPKIKYGFWLALIFSIVSLYFILQGVAKTPFRTGFANINWIYIGFGFLALFLMWIAKAFRMYSIGIGMGIKKRIGYYLQLYLATCFISHITPFSSGGTPFQVYLLHKKGVTLGRASVLTVIDLGINTAIFIVLIPIAFIINIRIVKDLQIVNPSFSAIIPYFIGSVIGGMVFFLILRYSKVSSKLNHWSWISKLRSSIKFKEWRQHILAEWELFKEGWMLLIHKHPQSIIWAFIASLLYWIFYLILAPLIFWAIGKNYSFLDLMGLQLIFNFIQVFLPTPGGSGGSEIILFYLFRNLTGFTRVGTFVLLWKIYTFFSTLIIGGFYFWKLTNKNS